MLVCVICSVLCAYVAFGPMRVRGINLSPDVYRDILEANVVAKHLVNGVLWPYSSTNMKAAPRWAELNSVRHMLNDILRASSGRGILQKGWEKACTSFCCPKLELDSGKVEIGAYRVRVMLTQLREYRRRRTQVPHRFKATLQVLLDNVTLEPTTDMDDDPSSPDGEKVIVAKTCKDTECDGVRRENTQGGRSLGRHISEASSYDLFGDSKEEVIMLSPTSEEAHDEIEQGAEKIPKGAALEMQNDDDMHENAEIPKGAALEMLNYDEMENLCASKDCAMAPDEWATTFKRPAALTSKLKKRPAARPVAAPAARPVAALNRKRVYSAGYHPARQKALRAGHDRDRAAELGRIAGLDALKKAGF